MTETISPDSSIYDSKNDPIVGVYIKRGSVTVALPKPNRHHNCIRYAVETLGISPLIKISSQGFYTSTGRILSREEAYQHAKRSGAIINLRPCHCTKQPKLYSEDLW